jgi:hypothetical protein
MERAGRRQDKANREAKASESLDAEQRRKFDDRKTAVRPCRL